MLGLSLVGSLSYAFLMSLWRHLIKLKLSSSIYLFYLAIPITYYLLKELLLYYCPLFIHPEGKNKLVSVRA
jgi:hypothetical protein